MNHSIRDVWQSLRSLRRPERNVPPLWDDERVDGQHALLVGEPSRLSEAVEAGLVRRGAEVLVACGGQAAEQGERAQLGSTRELSLSDLRAVSAFARELTSAGRTVDLLVLQANVTFRERRTTMQAFAEPLVVDYLAHVVLIERLFALAVLGSEPGRRPRIVFIVRDLGSRADDPSFDFTRFGAPLAFAPTDRFVALYAHALAQRLAERAGVYVCAPNALTSDAAHASPPWLHPAVSALVDLAGQTPDDAAEPILYACCAERYRKRTGVMLRQLREAALEFDNVDAVCGERLRDATEAALTSALGPDWRDAP